MECCTHGESFCCLKHVILQQDIELPCGCQSKDWQLRTSFPLDYLHRIQKRLSKLADWGDILDSTIDTSLEPTLEEYRNAYTKAKSNNEPIAFDLKHFLQECTEWIEEVETILSVEKRSLFLDLDIDGQIKRVEQLLDQAAWLPISTPLGSQLVEKYASIVESKFINDQINIPIL